MGGSNSKGPKDKESSVVRMQKYPAIPISFLVGQLVGATLIFDGEQKKWRRAQRTVLGELGGSGGCSGVTDAGPVPQANEDEPTTSVDQNGRDNRNFAQDGSAQTLSCGEVEKLKASGLCGEGLINKVIEGSNTFAEKTSFSQSKYLARKQLKYVSQVTIVGSFSDSQLSAELLCEVYASQQISSRVGFLSKPEILRSLLYHGNVSGSSAGFTLVYDECAGLVTAAAVKLMGGGGADSGGKRDSLPPVIRVVVPDPERSGGNAPGFGAPDKALRELLLPSETPPSVPFHVLWDLNLYGEAWVSTGSEPVVTTGNGGGTGSNSISTSWDTKINRRVILDGLLDLRRSRGGFDSVICACGGNTSDVMMNDRLPGLGKRWLRGSGSFAMVSPHDEPLKKLQQRLRARFYRAIDGGVSAEDSENLFLTPHVRVFEIFTREHQVAPGRTHPLMKDRLPLTQGIILAATHAEGIEEFRKREEERDLEMKESGANANQNGGAGKRRKKGRGR